MSYQTILVHLSSPDHAEQVLDVACLVAKQHDGFVIGLFAFPQIFVPAAVAAEAWGDILRIERVRHDKAAGEVRKIFEKKCKAAGIKSEWRELEPMTQVADAVIRNGFCADLLIAGQANPDADDYRLQEELTERMMLESGRPLLLVPYAGHFATIGSHPLVAWVAARESARAVHDAMGFLMKSKLTTVLTVNPQQRDGEATAATASQLAVTLARHGVEVKATTTTTDDLPVGSEILSRASDYGSDLLVMGGYGHSRFRETVFGGVTRNILRQMTVPVLMSH